MRHNPIVRVSSLSISGIEIMHDVHKTDNEYDDPERFYWIRQVYSYYKYKNIL